MVVANWLAGAGTASGSSGVPVPVPPPSGGTLHWTQDHYFERSRARRRPIAGVCTHCTAAVPVCLRVRCRALCGKPPGTIIIDSLPGGTLAMWARIGAVIVCHCSVPVQWGAASDDDPGDNLQLEQPGAGPGPSFASSRPSSSLHCTVLRHCGVLQPLGASDAYVEVFAQSTNLIVGSTAKVESNSPTWNKVGALHTRYSVLSVVPTSKNTQRGSTHCQWAVVVTVGVGSRVTGYVLRSFNPGRVNIAAASLLECPGGCCLLLGVDLHQHLLR
jgi:hypothetical protein